MSEAEFAKTRLSPAQYEVINVMSCLRRESDVAALKSVLVKFIDSRIQSELDGLYDEGKLSDERMHELSEMHLRTPYSNAL